jgi:hypothetical protein
MTLPSRPLPRPVRLRHARFLTLLRSGRVDLGRFSFATDDALAQARAIGPEDAAEAVASVLDAYESGGDHALCERAAHVVQELRLTGAIPALVRCAERLPQRDRVAFVACVALELLGPAAIEPLLEALGRARTPDARFAIGSALVLMPGRDGRVGVAFAAMLSDDPATAAMLLHVHGERRALPALRATLAGLDLPAHGPDAVAAEQIVTVGEAILALGGRLTAAQRAKLQRARAHTHSGEDMSGPEPERP